MGHTKESYESSKEYFINIREEYLTNELKNTESFNELINLNIWI
jgi:hypothetical protein